MDFFKQVYFLSGEQPPTGGGAGVVASGLYKKLKLIGVSTAISGAVEAQGSRFRVIQNSCGALLCIIKALTCKNIVLNDLFYKKLWLVIFRGYLSSRCLVYLHGSEPEYIIYDLRYRKMFIRLCAGSKHVICVSNYMRDKFLESLSLQERVSVVDKIIVIRTGVDQNIFFYEPRLEKSGLEDAPLIIVSASRLIRSKGYVRMARLIRDLREDLVIPVIWNIAGEGSDEAFIKEEVRQLGLQNCVVFHGHLEQNQLAELYRKSDIFLLLSEMRESLGLVYMEAASCGSYAIGYDCYGVKEAIFDGKTGSLVNSEKVDLYSTIAMRSEKNKISAASQRFNMEKMINNFITLVS